MWILILILIGVILLGLIAGYFYNRNLRKKIEKGELEETPEVKPSTERAADSMLYVKKKACWPP